MENKKEEEKTVEQTTIQHSSRVNLLKKSILLLLLFLVVLMSVWPLTELGKKQFNISFEKIEIPLDDEKPRMLKPRFHGLDSNRQPYNITADDAVKKDENNILMQNINADISLKNGEWISLLSDEGTYRVMDKQLDLNGSVNMFTDTGYEIFTQSAHLDFKENKASGNSAVVAYGPLGTMNANGFIVSSGGETVVFFGGVHLSSTGGE